MHGGASNSLCVRTKKQQILIRGEWYANCSQMAKHRFAVPSTNTCIWFANHLQTIRRARVYEAKQNVHTMVPILEKFYENTIIAFQLSTFHAMKKYPCYRNCKCRPFCYFSHAILTFIKNSCILFPRKN